MREAATELRIDSTKSRETANKPRTTHRNHGDIGARSRMTANRFGEARSAKLGDRLLWAICKTNASSLRASDQTSGSVLFLETRLENFQIYGNAGLCDPSGAPLRCCTGYEVGCPGLRAARKADMDRARVLARS